MEILQNFGIQPILLLAQIVNFLIILYLLKRFFYKPIQKVLADRQKRIEESLKNADLIEERLKKTQEKQAQILEGAAKSAQEILQKAQDAARQQSANSLNETKKSAEELLTRAKEEIQAQRVQMEKEVEKHTVTLVTEVVKKVLSKHLSSRQRQDLTEKAAMETERYLQ